MAAPNNDAWTFTCIDCPIILEESIRFSGPGAPRKSEQIVVYVDVTKQDNIRWVLERRLKKAPTRSGKNTKSQPETPDLLDALNKQLPPEQQTSQKDL